MFEKLLTGETGLDSKAMRKLAEQLTKAADERDARTVARKEAIAQMRHALSVLEGN